MLNSADLKDRFLQALQRGRISKPRDFAHLEHTVQPVELHFESQFPHRSTVLQLECSLPMWDLCMQNRYSLENAITGTDRKEAEANRREFTEGTYAKYCKRAR